MAINRPAMAPVRYCMSLDTFRCVSDSRFAVAEQYEASTE
jgi:hypothetical protein